MVWTLIGHFAYFIKSQQCWELSFLHTNERETAWKRGEGGVNLIFPFCPFISTFRLSKVQWVLALIFQQSAARRGAISLRAKCRNQMQWCVKASSSNSPLTEGIYSCVFVFARMHTSVCFWPDVFGYAWCGVRQHGLIVFPAVLS